MSPDADVLTLPSTERALDEHGTVPGAQGMDTGWGRLELATDRVVHVWPRADRELVEALRNALAPSSRRSSPRPCGGPGSGPGGGPDSGVLVLSAAAEGAAAMLAAVRGCAATRLRPVAIVGQGPATPDFARLADAVLTAAPAGLRLGLPPLEALSERVDELPDASHLPSAEQCELDFLRFLATRDVEELAPVPDSESPIGYRQPLAEALLRRTPEGALDTLEEIHAAGHLEAVPTESIFLCGSCNSSRLSVREVCPGCRAPALAEESVIHHFRCAHVGPSASFQRPGGLVCPKCEHALRHAGVDHDRPGVNMRCRRCDLRVVEGVAEARCLSCDRRAGLDDLRRLELSTYRPLPSLERLALRAISPLTTSSELLRMALPTLEPVVHALLRERAEATCRRYGRPATVVRIQVRDLVRLQEKLGRRELRRRIESLARGLATIVRTTDLVSVDDNAAVEIVLVETDVKGAELALQRLAGVLAADELIGLDVSFHVEPLVGQAPS